MDASLELLAGVVAMADSVPSDVTTDSGGAVRRAKRTKLEPASAVVVSRASSCARAAAPNGNAKAVSKKGRASQNARAPAALGGLQSTDDEAENDLDGPATDTKRALRAERNRQSAAASRERKKRHVKELESRVKYLADMTTSLQYRAHLEGRQWADKEKQMLAELAGLRSDNVSLEARLCKAHETINELHVELTNSRPRPLPSLQPSPVHGLVLQPSASPMRAPLSGAPTGGVAPLVTSTNHA